MFENEEPQHPQTFQTQTSRIIHWVIKYSGGYVKDEQQAHYVLIGFVVMSFFITFFILFSSSTNKANIEAPPGYEIIYPENEPPRLQKKLVL